MIANGLFGSLEDSKRAGIIIKLSIIYFNPIFLKNPIYKKLKNRIFPSKIFKKCYINAAGINNEFKSNN